MSYLFTGIIFILILGVLVFIHELGHFLLARRAGMKVEEFGLGIPPRLKAWEKFGTLVTLNAIPIGGFVRVKGGDTFHVTEEELKDPENYHSKTWFERFWFICAGVIMNLLLAFFLIFVGYLIGMTPLPGSSLYDDVIKNSAGVVVSQIKDASPASIAGIKEGDILISLDDLAVNDPKIFTDYIKKNPAKEFNLTIKRSEELKNIKITPGADGLLGIYMNLYYDVQPIRLLPHQAFYHAFLNVSYITKETFLGIIKVFSKLFLSFTLPEEVSGPVGIVGMTHQVVKIGIMPILQFMAVLSISLAAINIFPFPALDGGRLLFLVVEAITRKRVDAKIENYIHILGFGLLLLMIFAVTYRDIIRIFN